jgi:hypothetical protein
MCVTTRHVSPGISATRGCLLTRSRAVVERNPILRIEKTLQRCRFQVQKGAQQFVRMNNVAATFAMGDYDPTPSATEYLRREIELRLDAGVRASDEFRLNTDRRSTMRALPPGKAVLFSPLDLPWSSPFRDSVLFFKTRFETLQIHRNPWLRALRRRPQILHRPRDWLL